MRTGMILKNYYIYIKIRREAPENLNFQFYNALWTGNNQEIFPQIGA
uniref:Uncharacterized protein n=1 Tax=Romanomermis culicivorax TaxID=13658 RepID=A0A915JS30_ROMCU